MFVIVITISLKLQYPAFLVSFTFCFTLKKKFYYSIFCQTFIRLIILSVFHCFHKWHFFMPCTSFQFALTLIKNIQHKLPYFSSNSKNFKFHIYFKHLPWNGIYARKHKMNGTIININFIVIICWKTNIFQEHKNK